MYSDEDSLNKIRRSLYSRDGARSQRPRRTRGKESEQIRDTERDWGYEPVDHIKPEKQKPVKEKNSRLSLFFWISIIIFVLTLGFVVYRFFFATNLMSSKNVIVKIEAPTTVRAGSEIGFDVSVENKNKANLIDAKLIMTFPENTLSADESGEKLSRLVLDIGTVRAGATERENIEVFLFGKEDDDVDIVAELEYGAENSDLRLSTDATTHTVRISSAPILLKAVPNLRSVQSGQEFEIEVDVTSNVNIITEDVLVRVDYPSSFTLISANPSPVVGDNVWSLGDLPARETDTITIRGFVEGLNNEDRFFAFSTGTSGQNFELGRLYASVREPVRITLPPISLTTSINQSSNSVVSTSTGRDVTVNINWRNNLGSAIRNLVIEAEIDEDFIEERSIRVNSGFYQSLGSTAIWDQSTNIGFQSIRSGESGSVALSFKILGGNDIRGVVNPEIPIRITATAREAQTSETTRALRNDITRTVRIASSLGVSQDLYYQAGPFINTGPVPPRAENETTYTVTWSVTNAANSATNTSVRAALPAYVEFVEAENPQAVRYSELTNEVVWNIGDVGEGVGITGGRLSTSFQVKVLPSRSQVGGAPIIVREAIISGTDSFTRANLNSSSSAVTTSSLRESGAGNVVR